MTLFHFFNGQLMLSTSCYFFLGPLSIRLVFEWFTVSDGVDSIEFVF